ncbi:MAG: peptide chain release factor-like protein [Endomicrobium sp.]|jgi:protein subunit release factor B|nr:peptide chain release factor-like protein [Endomicrobium sp.]
MIDFGVTLKKHNELESKFKKYNINEADIEEKFIRSSGNGGQNVNKVSTAVYLKHVPSGIEVKCSKERTQGKNRFFARRLLVEKLEEQLLGVMSSKRKEIEKIRQQKRKRSKRAKEKILQIKKKTSIKKKMRGKVIC